MNNKQKKILDLDLVERNNKKSLTFGEIKALNRKPGSKLTTAERKIRDESNRKFADALKSIPTLENIFQFQEPELPKIDLTNYNPPANSAQQKKTNQLLERLAIATEQQNKDRDADIHEALKPRYDTKNSFLYFANTPIQLVKNSELDRFCRKLFRAGKPVKSPVEIGDFYNVLDIEGLDKQQKKKKVYNLKSSLNELVTKNTETTISDLLVVTDKKIWFNEKYL